MDQIKWLNTNPKLEELSDRYPEVWEEVGQELITAANTGLVENLNKLAIKAKSSAEVWKTRIAKSRNNPKVIESAVLQIVRSRMLVLALEKGNLAAAAGKLSGKVRLNLVNGYIIQKLLFKRHLTRKPASLKLFKFWWRFITQKKLLMPLVKDRGIYCFYSKELIKELSALIGEKECLEIGAGDGTLASFLNARGVRVIATDDFSWSHVVKFPESIEKLDAKQALIKYKPTVVLCSWPPTGNDFEEYVLKTKSVETYIVIGSRYKYVSGNWDAYAKNDAFDWAIDERLSGLVIPPDSGNAVIIFRRKPGS